MSESYVMASSFPGISGTCGRPPVAITIFFAVIVVAPLNYYNRKKSYKMQNYVFLVSKAIVLKYHTEI